MPPFCVIISKDVTWNESASRIRFDCTFWLPPQFIDRRMQLDSKALCYSSMYGIMLIHIWHVSHVYVHMCARASVCCAAARGSASSRYRACLIGLALRHLSTFAAMQRDDSRTRPLGILKKEEFDETLVSYFSESIQFMILIANLCLKNR